MDFKTIDWKQLLFSFEGRINRAPYWLVPLVLMLFVLLLALVFYAVLGSYGAGAVAIIGFLPLLVIGLALGVKRLHDRDKSGHWLWLYYLFPGVLDGIGSVIDPASRGIGLVFSIISFGVSLWGVIDLGFLRGTPGTNKYGQNPLEVPQAAPLPVSRF